MNSISTLYKLQQRLNLDASTDTARLRTALETASTMIERLTGRRFVPYQATRTQHVLPENRTVLLLDDDLISLSILSDDRGALIALSDVMLLPDDNAVASIIQALNGVTFDYSETSENAISVTGIWGWHHAPTTMWRDSGDSVGDNPLSASATTITITDSTLADSAGESPRFQVGHVLKIDDEYLRVIAVNDTSLSVMRGVNGTVATTHSQSTMIATYQPAPDVDNLCLRLAVWQYRAPDQRGSGGVPVALKHEIEALRRVRVR